MAYSTFTVPPITYHLVGGNHMMTTKDDLFEKEKIKTLDAIVLETGSIPQDNVPSVMSYPQYEWIVSQAKSVAPEKSIPFFMPDSGMGGVLGALAGGAAQMGLARLVLRRLAFPLFVAGTASVMAPTLYTGKLPSWVPYGQALLNLPMMGVTTTMRSAAVAKKLEGYISPMLQTRTPNPQVAIVFGAGHADIRVFLSHPSLRDTLLDCCSWLVGLSEKKYQDYTTEARYVTPTQLKTTKHFTPVYKEFI